MTYRGNVDAYEIFEDICSGINGFFCVSFILGMKTPAPACSEMELDSQMALEKSEDSSYVTLIAFIVSICVVFMLFMIFIYRRMLRREMQKEMGQQVN